MKKIIAYIMILATLFCLVACVKQVKKEDIAGEWKRSSYYNQVLELDCFNTLLLKSDGTYSEVVADPVLGTVYLEIEGTWYWNDEKGEVRLKKDGSANTTILEYNQSNNTLFQDEEVVYTKEGS